MEIHGLFDACRKEGRIKRQLEQVKGDKRARKRLRKDLRSMRREKALYYQDQQQGHWG